MIEDQAAFGVVALILVVVVISVAVMRANKISNTFVNAVVRLLRTRIAITGLLLLMGGLLLYGVASYGLVNSLPYEGHIERNRESNRMVITEDKQGCIDMRTLGRSNGVYLSVKPCKSGVKMDDKKAAADQ